jgi:hypothetical protein
MYMFHPRKLSPLLWAVPSFVWSVGDLGVRIVSTGRRGKLFTEDGRMGNIIVRALHNGDIIAMFNSTNV